MPDDLCVAHVPIFSRLGRAQQEQVAAVARPVSVAPGETLYQQGGPPAPLIVLHKGMVKLTRITANGHERVLQVMEPGDFVGEASLLSGGRPDHSAIAITDATLCTVGHEDFGALLAAHPQIGFEMLGALSRRLAGAQDKLDQSNHEVGTRVADYLLGLEGDYSAGGVRIELPLPKKDVASLLGTTPESLSRALAKLVEQDVIELNGPRGIMIVDVEALSAIALLR